MLPARASSEISFRQSWRTPPRCVCSCCLRLPSDITVASQRIGDCDSGGARAMQLGKREWLSLNDGYRATRGHRQGKRLPKQAGSSFSLPNGALRGTLAVASDLPRAARSLGTAVWRACPRLRRPLPCSLPAQSRFKGRGWKAPRRLSLPRSAAPCFATVDGPSKALFPAVAGILVVRSQ
jgi:hypothetical protein